MNAWEKNIRQVEPYTPGEQPKRADIVKLNTNENPTPPSPKVAEVLKNMDYTLFRKYPDTNGSPLREALAGYYGVKPEQVFLGVGSDDVLGMAFLTFFNGPDPVLFPDITYSFYDVWANLFRIPYETQALDENLEIRVSDYKKKNGGIVIANPNAPTGTFLPLEQLEDIIRWNQESVVVVDEAYVDFGGQSALPLVEKYENLLVVQTFSKSRSFAGVRIGFAIGQAPLIAAMNAVKNSYNSYTMTQPSILLGTAAVEDRAWFEESCQRVIRTREQFKKDMAALGFTFGDSMTNFLFVTRKGTDMEKLFTDLREEGIFVRWFNKPRIRDYLRISIGTEEEMERLVAFLKKWIAGTE